MDNEQAGESPSHACMVSDRKEQAQIGYSHDHNTSDSQIDIEDNEVDIEDGVTNAMQSIKPAERLTIICDRKDVNLFWMM